MNNKKLISAILAGVLSTSIVGCCGSGDNSEIISEESQSVEVIEDTRLFQPYEHVFFERHYNSDGVYSQSITRGQLEVPEGYAIIEIENFNEKYGHGSQTGGYDVWYTNTVEVRATSVINEKTGEVEFSLPGKVVNNEDIKTYKK